MELGGAKGKLEMWGDIMDEMDIWLEIASNQIVDENTWNKCYKVTTLKSFFTCILHFSIQILKVRVQKFVAWAWFFLFQYSSINWDWSKLKHLCTCWENSRIRNEETWIFILAFSFYILKVSLNIMVWNVHSNIKHDKVQWWVLGAKVWNL